MKKETGKMAAQEKMKLFKFY